MDSSLHLEYANDKVYVYGNLQSGMCICYGVYDEEADARAKIDELNKIDERQAA